MKINKLETHDRLEHLIQDQSANVFQGAEDCLKKNRDSLALQEKSPYIYIFAHPRTTDDGLNKRMLWQPRLSIPKAQTNSYLFRALSHSDTIEIIWMIPPREMWKQYEKGKVTENNEVAWSIEMFQHKRSELEKPHKDDMTEEQGRLILKSIVDERLEEIKAKKLLGTSNKILFKA